MTVIDKPAWNEEYRTCEFRRPDGRGPLNADETVQTVVSVLCIERATGTDRSSTMIANASPYSGSQVKYQLKGGTAGETYFRIIRIVSSNGQKLEDKALVNVI